MSSCAEWSGQGLKSCASEKRSDNGSDLPFAPPRLPRSGGRAKYNGVTRLPIRRLSGLLLVWAALIPLTTGCAVRRFAVNRVGNALAVGGSAYATDDDPELIKAAAPFSLKLVESLLVQSPRHRGLLLAATSGFTQYAYAFVQEEADETEDRDVAAARALRDRSRRLYLRARDYGLRGLATRYPRLRTELRDNPARAVGRVKRRDDVPLLYWTAAAWGGAIAVSKDRPELVADLPAVGALLERALALDETFDRGALHSLMISYELARPGTKPDEALARARTHYDRALALADGHLAGPYVTWAEQVCIQQQDKAQFTALLTQALAVDADAEPPHRLANLIIQRRAKWLLARTEDLFAE
jgi:predicted anti-sigma-YlaC factor YlaD